MTTPGWIEDADDYDELDDDWYDDDGYREPDPEDAEIARSYEEYYEHCEKAHGGGECDCRPPLRERLAWRLQDAKRWLRHLAGKRRVPDEPPF